MTSSQKISQLKQEVTRGAYDDWKRDTVDEAKKRAIYHAPTYDAFKALVAGCKYLVRLVNHWLIRLSKQLDL